MVKFQSLVRENSSCNISASINCALSLPVSIARLRKPLLQLQVSRRYAKQLLKVSIARSRKLLLQPQISNDNSVYQTCVFQSLVRENSFCNDGEIFNKEDIEISFNRSFAKTPSATFSSLILPSVSVVGFNRSFAKTPSTTHLKEVNTDMLRQKFQSLVRENSFCNQEPVYLDGGVSRWFQSLVRENSFCNNTKFVETA